MLFFRAEDGDIFLRNVGSTYETTTQKNIIFTAVRTSNLKT
jgi:hypothetical protein